MTNRRDGWNIVLAGFWNRSIFLPEWVFPRLFPKHELPENTVITELALLPALPLIYRDPQVAMEISSGLLAFKPQVLDNDCLLRCEHMAREMLERLPETPVHAVGINFGFRENLPSKHVGAMFRDIDDAELERQSWAIGERKLSRTLTQSDDTLNLTLTSGGEVVDFDFNFHTVAGPAANAAAKRAVEEGRVLRLRDAALTVLRETYHLEIGDENAGTGG
jgi:hypothetical protein